jgi:hypothetical protein
MPKDCVRLSEPRPSPKRNQFYAEKKPLLRQWNIYAEKKPLLRRRKTPRNKKYIINWEIKKVENKEGVALLFSDKRSYLLFIKIILYHGEVMFQIVRVQGAGTDLRIYA